MKERNFDSEHKRVIDIHFHIYDFDRIRKDYDKNSKIRENNDWLDKGRMRIGEDKMIKDLREEDMIKLIDDWGIEKAILHPLSTKDIYGFDKMSNERVFHFVDRYPDKFLTCVELNPKEKTSLDRLEEYVKSHEVKSVNMNPNFFGGFFYNDKEIYPYYEKIQELGLPIMMHTGPALPCGRVKHNNPLAVDDVAYDFPNLKIVIEHMGYPWTDVAYSIAMKNKNVHIGLSGILNYIAKSNPIYMKIELQKMLNTIGPEKILFGTDTPSVGGGKIAIDFIKNYKNTLLDSITKAKKVGEKEKNMILRENAKRLFNI